MEQTVQLQAKKKNLWNCFDNFYILTSLQIIILNVNSPFSPNTEFRRLSFNEICNVVLSLYETLGRQGYFIFRFIHGNDSIENTVLYNTKHFVDLSRFSKAIGNPYCKNAADVYFVFGI